MAFHDPDTWPPASPQPAAPASSPLHRAMFAIDITGFGRRNTSVHLHLRAALYRIVTDALTAIGVPFATCHHEDRGDGLLVIAPASVSAELFLGPLPAHLHAGLRRHNRLSSPPAQMQLRAGVNAGYVHIDDHGACGRALIHLYRLLDAPLFKSILKEHPTDLGLITSHYLYQELIDDNPGPLDPGAFTQIAITAKETYAPAWIWLAPAAPAPRQPGALAADGGPPPFHAVRTPGSGLRSGRALGD
ncbi:hypothetical protein DPM19_23220 [Actinomadura craniellae]|uniref:Guanylate cyclase domain-containing protein n=1 Tax=Actinomadura craniellae TaxID=2231787 RepID=A0A365H3X4_9ACTN|nr:hypothetical protein [Actinomadura craniellae]RAY12923.1 hypothetical protein DPM19_23220 [Actinomadura craniellae]